MSVAPDSHTDFEYIRGSRSEIAHDYAVNHNNSHVGELGRVRVRVCKYLLLMTTISGPAHHVHHA